MDDINSSRDLRTGTQYVGNWASRVKHMRRSLPDFWTGNPSDSRLTGTWAVAIPRSPGTHIVGLLVTDSI